MHDEQALAREFELHRGHLQHIANRILGSPDEADDAVQEAWLRLARADARVENLLAWLRTVVSRICLDMLRARRSRREEFIGLNPPGERSDPALRGDPERETLLADSVGRALLVVLNALSPLERVAFVLHDMFSVPFDQIAPIVDRSPDATKQLASRARRRVRGNPEVRGAELARHRQAVAAFLAASRAGDINAILTVLDPDVVRRADRFAIPSGRDLVARGAAVVANEIAVFGRNAHHAEPLLVNGSVGIVVAPRGRAQVVMLLTVREDRIVEYELVADPKRLDDFEFALLDAPEVVGA